MEITTQNEAETETLATSLARDLKPGDTILLRGLLGTGKSVFARAMIRTLCADPGLEVPSPTFTLVQQYDAPLAPLWHFDFYRLKAPEDIYELGWEEALSGGIIIAEWPEKIGSLAPRPRLDILIQPSRNEADTRIITITDNRKTHGEIG